MSVEVPLSMSLVNGRFCSGPDDVPKMEFTIRCAMSLVELVGALAEFHRNHEASESESAASQPNGADAEPAAAARPERRRVRFADNVDHCSAWREAPSPTPPTPNAPGPERPAVPPQPGLEGLALSHRIPPPPPPGWPAVAGLEGLVYGEFSTDFGWDTPIQEQHAHMTKEYRRRTTWSADSLQQPPFLLTDESCMREFVPDTLTPAFYLGRTEKKAAIVATVSGPGSAHWMEYMSNLGARHDNQSRSAGSSNDRRPLAAARADDGDGRSLLPLNSTLRASSNRPRDYDKCRHQ